MKKNQGLIRIITVLIIAFLTLSIGVYLNSSTESKSLLVGGGSGTINPLPQLVISKNEGTTLTTRTASLDFVGAGVTATNTGNAVTVTISGGSGTIDGSGTTNELSYWVDSDTLGALAVATYPSLTELSYGKGVTSAIQTQLNAKQASDTQLTSLAGLSYGSNGGKFIRVNAGETDFELATVSGTGTVTSVAMTVPTGLTITGSPVTTTGTLAVALDTGYVIPLQSTLDGYAVKALSNLASVAINTSLVSDTDATDDLGTTLLKWNNIFGVNLGATGTRFTTGWFTDLAVTNAIAGSITGNAATVTNGVYTTGSGTVFEVPLTFGDGLTRTTNDIDLDTTVNILKISGLTSNGFVKTSGGDGTLSVDTNTYLTSLSGAVLTDQTVGQTIGLTGSRLTKLWATDITVTNAITGSVTGNAGTATALAADPSDCSSNQFANAINASGTLTCSALTLAGAQFANQGTTTTVLHGNASGNPSWSGIVSADITNGTITLADTAITAGRSLTIATDDISADAELYTDSKTLYFENPVSADDFKSIWVAPQASTITAISCESDQTVNFDLQVDDGTATGVNGSDIACTSFATDSSLAGDTTLASGDRLDLAVASVSGTPTWVSITFKFTYDD